MLAAEMWLTSYRRFEPIRRRSRLHQSKNVRVLLPLECMYDTAIEERMQLLRQIWKSTASSAYREANIKDQHIARVSLELRLSDQNSMLGRFIK